MFQLISFWGEAVPEELPREKDALKSQELPAAGVSSPSCSENTRGTTKVTIESHIPPATERRSHRGCSPKYPILGETEAEAKPLTGCQQDLKADIPGVSQPGCCLCGEPGYPWRRFLSWVVLQVPGSLEETQLGENKTNQALH